MSKYYDKDGYMKEEAFKKELDKLNKRIEEGADIEELKKIRKRLYYLKSRYEECGRYNSEKELTLYCINEMLHDC